MMKEKHGSLFSAWRNFLDADRNGIVTQRDFANACRILGVRSVQQIWAEFDVDGNGQISLKELDPDLGATFGALEQAMNEQYGTLRKAWREVFNKDNTLTCDKEKFIAGCEKLGLQGTPLTPEKLFKQLRPEAGRPFLTFGDLWNHTNNSQEGSPDD